MEVSEKPKFPATKLCVICHSRRKSNVLEGFYDVFILDPCENNSDSDAFVPRVPDLTFKGLGSMCFCVLNSSLYMFESPGFSREKEGIRKSVYTLDLSAFLSDSEEKSLKNDSNDCAQLLQPAPCMHGVKLDTAAVVTPRGQILVFSRRVYFEQLPERVDFEVYDPVTSSWRVLPRLCPRREKKSDYYFDITGYCFLSESLFCVKAMNGIGAFALDLDGDREWNRVDLTSLGWYDCGGGQFFILDDELGLYLTPRGVRRRGCGYFGVFNFPYSWGSETYHQMSLTSVDSSNQELRFCDVETMHHHEHFYTTVDAWCCDLAKYKAEINNNDNDNKGLGCGQLSATRNSFKFAPKVEGEEVLVNFFPYAILPFGPDAFSSNSSFSHSHN